MHILIDGDPIVYRNGVAGEKRVYFLVVENTETGELIEEVFENGNDMRPFLKDNPHYEVVDKEMHVDPLPIEYALGPIKRTLKAIQQEVQEKFYRFPEEVTFQVYLTGGGNFRELIAQERPYKGTRDRAARPYWYEECRKYLIDHWGAKVIEGYEADDEISIEARSLWQQKIPHVIATVDKDLDQIPGPHFDYGKKVWYHMDEEDALMFFYEQVLCGDSTDNIPGLWRIGKTKAEEMVKRWCGEWYALKHPQCTMEEYLWLHVVLEYEASIEKHPDKYVSHDADVVALENARLVKMQEHYGQLWTPPGQPDEDMDYE